MATQDTADHIDKGIHHADFVKMHITRRNPMGQTFRLSQPIEDGAALCLYRIGQGAVRKNSPNAG